MVRPSQLFASLDESRFTRRHATFYIIGTIGHISDGFDLTMLGFILPLIVATFHLTPARAGALGSSAFLGMLVGAVAIGMLSDRFGRRRAFALALLIYIIFGGAITFVQSYGAMLAFRALEGVGLGAEVVVVFAYLAELLPAKSRGGLLASTAAVWQLSSLIAAAASIALVPHYSWRALFLVGALLALVVLLLWGLLPESVRSLVHAGRLDAAERVVRSLSTVDPASLPATERREEPPPAAGGMRSVFGGRYLKPTLSVWLMGFAFGFVFFGITVWLPSILLKMGFGFVHSLLYSGLIIAAGAVGNAVGGLLLDVIGRRATLALYYFAGGALLFAWGGMHTAAGILTVGCLAAFFAFGVFGASFTYGSELYPTRQRGMGAGWMGAWQRIGGFVAPTVLGVMLGAKVSTYVFFASLGVLYLLTGVVVLALAFETRGKSLEKIEAELGSVGVVP